MKIVEIIKITMSLLIKRAKLIFKIIHPTNETTSAVKNLTTLYVKNKSFIILLYHKGNK